MKVEVDITGISNLEGKFKNLLSDETMFELHDMFAKFVDMWVPMKEGILSQEISVTPECVHYTSPWAHYMYTGVVYGPNIPIYEDGVIVGYWSPPEKHPTGKSIEYSTEKHELATHHWDQAAMEAKGEVFLEDVKTILIRRLKEGK